MCLASSTQEAWQRWLFGPRVKFGHLGEEGKTSSQINQHTANKTKQREAKQNKSRKTECTGMGALNALIKTDK